jgi:hypothetical protein
MTDAQNTLRELRALLSRFSGVNVEAADVSITELPSLGAVTYCAGGANVPVDVWSGAPQGDVGARSDPQHLRYFVRSLNAHGGFDAALDRFAMLGNFLAWHLHAVGSIPPVRQTGY